jgi:hypothetical protein
MRALAARCWGRGSDVRFHERRVGLQELERHRHCEAHRAEAIQTFRTVRCLDCFAPGFAPRRFGGLLPGEARAASLDGSLAMTSSHG